MGAKMWVDAHHHLWRYDAAEFGWIGESMGGLRRDFPVAEFEAVAAEHDVVASLAVQARQSLEETRWLLEVAATSEVVAGVVGWVPLVEPGVEAVLEGLCLDEALVGVRHVLQDEADPGYMLGAEFGRGIGLLERFGLVYDVLITEAQMPQAITLVDRHPRQSFVLDHMGKPRIAEGEMEPWAREVRRLAERPNVCCKISGMVTEAVWSGWTAADLRPYLEVVLEAFGPGRLMFGSDWPVMTVASSYGRWQGVVAAMLEGLSEDETEEIRRGTAMRVYGVGLR